MRALIVRASVGARSVTAVTLSSAVFVALALLTANLLAQREWLERKWLYKNPHALTWLAIWTMAAGVACAVTVAAARRRRLHDAPLVSLRWLPLVLVAASLWLTGVPRPVQVFDVWLALAGCASAWSVAQAVVAWSATRSRPRWLERCEALALGLSVALIAGELTLRTARAWRRAPLLATAGTDVDAWLAAHKRRPGSHHFGFEVDERGFVDEPPSSAGARIACIGDSFGVGVVPHHLHFTTVAERELGGTPIYNASVVNAGPREYERILERDIAPLGPELVVVALFLGNDVEDAERVDTDGIASWLDPDETLMHVVPRRMMALAAERELDGGIASHSTAQFGLPAELALDAATIERRLPWLSDPLREPPTMTRERFLYVEHTRTQFLHSANAPRFASLFESLERMRAHAAPAKLACLLIPDEFQVEDELWRELLATGLSPSAERDLPQQSIGEWLAAHAVPFVDLLPLLRAEAPLADGSRHLFHARDTHFNARGNAVAGRGLARLVRSAATVR